jgi:hypothetical protein
MKTHERRKVELELKVWGALDKVRPGLPPGVMTTPVVEVEPNGEAMVKVEITDLMPDGIPEALIAVCGLFGPYEDLLEEEYHLTNLLAAIRLEVALWKLSNRDAFIKRYGPAYD